MNGEPEGRRFNEPPAEVGHDADAQELGEEAVEQFAVPSEAGGVTEVAAVAEQPESLSGVSMELLEIKQAIEERMR
jgi:hypothetical protein